MKKIKVSQWAGRFFLLIFSFPLPLNNTVYSIILSSSLTTFFSITFPSASFRSSRPELLSKKGVLKGSLLSNDILKIYRTITIKKCFRIFWNYFWNILEISVFQNKNQGLCKKHVFLKKLMGLLIIAGAGLLLSQEHIKERRKRKQWTRPSIRKRFSKCSLCI